MSDIPTEVAPAYSPAQGMRTVDVRPRWGSEMVKAKELIDVGLVDDVPLPLYTRQVYNLLLRNAHGPDLLKPGATFAIETAKLTISRKGELFRLLGALDRLLTTRVDIFGGAGWRVTLLGGHDLVSKSRRIGWLHYSMHPSICQVLAGSTVYAKLDMEVMSVVRSKYALSLYESMARRVSLDRVHTEIMTLDYFRDAILQVEKSKFPNFPQLRQSAIEPAIREVNALAHFTLTWEPIRRGRKVTHIRVLWRLKEHEEMPTVGAELLRRRPKSAPAPLLDRPSSDPLLDA